MAIAATVSGVISRSRALTRVRGLVSIPIPTPRSTPALNPAAASPTPVPSPAPVDASDPDRASIRALALISLLAAAPFLLSTLVLLAGPNDFVLRGDAAVIELAVRNASDFAQHLGPYSRFGWTHPGPAWFYALAPIYVLGGETATSLLAATQFLNAVVCVLIVLAVSRRRLGPAVGAACGVLVFVLAAPGAVFAEIWNPYATVLPALLFLVLIARAVDGSVFWVFGAGIVGSFLVQTHLGAALPVGASLAAAALVLLIRGVVRLVVLGILMRARAFRFTWRWSWLYTTLASVAALVVMWIPTMLDQRDGIRNLTMLHKFLKLTQKTGTGHTAAQGLVLIDRLVVPPPWSVDPAAVLTPGPVTATTALGLCGFVLVNLGIAVLAWRRGVRTAAVLAALAVLLVPAGIAAVVQIEGNLHDYLIAWFLAVPGATILAVCQLLATVLVERVSKLDCRPAPASVSGSASARMPVAALVLFATTATAFFVPRVGHSTDCCTQNDVLRADRALVAATSSAPYAGAPINIQYEANGEWPLATGLAAVLAEHGWSPRFPSGPAWTFKLPAGTRDPRVPTVWIRSGTEAPQPGYRFIAKVPGVAMWQEGAFVGIVELRLPG